MNHIRSGFSHSEASPSAHSHDGVARNKLLLIGRTADQQVIRACIIGQGDPAAFSTSRMLSEAGLCLALDVSKAKVAGGFWTPATALGDKLIKRLEENALVHFELIA